MDERPDGPSSRPPTLDDVVDLCRALNEAMDVELLRARIEEERALAGRNR